MPKKKEKLTMSASIRSFLLTSSMTTSTSDILVPTTLIFYRMTHIFALMICTR